MSAHVESFELYLWPLATYRIFFHPLSKYPGPVLAKLTSLVWTYHFTKGDIIRWNDELHTKYGETVRSGPNRLSFIGPRAWKDIYGHKHGQYKPNVKNLERFVGKLTSNVHPMATEPTMAGHAAQKRQFNHAFSDRALTEQESLIGKYIDQLIQLVRKEVAKSPNNKPEVDVAKLYNFTTFDVMGDLTFGEGLGQLETGIESSWVQAVFVTFKFMTVRSVMKAYPLGGFLYSAFAPKGVMEDCARHIQSSNALVDKRLEKGNNGRPDIFGFILRQPGEKMSRPLMNANAGMFMMSGTETTATALTSMTWCLLNNPEKLEKVVREIRAVPKESGLTSNVLKNMKYMNAVIEEGMRMYPSGQVGLGSQREIAPGGNWVCGEYLPEKTQVTVPSWTAFNSPLYWKDPLKFVPERWLPEETEYSKYHDYDNHAAWLPFGTGPRACIGQNVALHEMRSILARFLYNFDLELSPETMDWHEKKVKGIWAKPSLKVRTTLAK
ncbi:cytochrome P450 [Diaporthe sp. PMI_573]|nr:cytochrome P450 [Diaporthaceae sp. PMI_573]